MFIEVRGLSAGVDPEEKRRLVLNPTLEEQRDYVEELLSKNPKIAVFKETLSKINTAISRRDTLHIELMSADEKEAAMRNDQY